MGSEGAAVLCRAGAAVLCSAAVSTGGEVLLGAVSGGEAKGSAR